MSAGSGSIRFSGYFDFYFTTTQSGQQVVGTITQIQQASQGLQQQQQAGVASARNYGSSMRRLALDFRLVSSSVRNIVRGLGLQNTIVGTGANALVVLTSAATGALSAYMIWSRITKDLKNNTSPLVDVLNKLSPIIKIIMADLAYFLIAIAAVAVAVMALNFAFNEISGVNRYRQSIKDLEEDVENLELSLRSLRLEQGRLGVQSASLAAQQAELDAALALGTMGVEAHADASELLSANQAVLSTSTANVALAESYYGSRLSETNAALEDEKTLLEEAQARKWDMIMTQGMTSGLAGARRPADPLGISSGISDYIRSLLGFESGGIISATGPIMAHAGEQLIPAGESAGGAVSLTISMEGANIYGREGMEEALEVGGNKLRKQLEYMRRPRTRW